MVELTTHLLAEPEFEVIPLKGTLAKAALIPAGSLISVTASPTKGMDPTVDLSLELAERGYRVVPHLSARMIKDRAELGGIIKRLADGGIEQALVVGGDNQEPGDYVDALSLLRDMAEIDHSFAKVGIAGYPEGHPFIEAEQLRQVLIDKQPYATYIATQMCFSVRAITDWVRTVRVDGVELPVKVGIPGVIDPTRLLTIAARIGVGASARFLAKNRRTIFRLLRPRPFNPDRLVRSLARSGEGLGLAGLHIFTFNQVASTLEWYQRARASA